MKSWNLLFVMLRRANAERMLTSVSLKYMYMDLMSVIFKLMGKDKKMESMQSNFSDISSSKQETSSSRVGKLLMMYMYKSLFPYM